jgi:hypothetical protein
MTLEVGSRVMNICEILSFNSAEIFLFLHLALQIFHKNKTTKERGEANERKKFP